MTFRENLDCSPKIIKALIIIGLIEGAIVTVWKVDRADLSGSIEFLIMVLPKISRKLIAIL